MNTEQARNVVRMSERLNREGQIDLRRKVGEFSEHAKNLASELHLWTLQGSMDLLDMELKAKTLEDAAHALRCEIYVQRMTGGDGR